MDKEQAEKVVREAQWVHSFELTHGIWTPGLHKTDAKAILNERFALPMDLAGKTALDIGALDGPYSFELERRGAKVISLDIQSPDVTGYNAAKAVLGSRNEYVQGNVYELDRILGGISFDLILFFGVWYHLKHPVLAFEQISKALKADGLLLFEGEVLKNYAENTDGSVHADADLVAAMAESDLPITLYYSGPFKKDQWNWFVPNRACVNEWIKTAGMQMTGHGFWDSHPHQRMYGTAVKQPGAVIHVDNPVWPKQSST